LSEKGCLNVTVTRFVRVIMAMFSKWQHSRWVLRAHQTRNARIVPPKISNASPHKEKFIAQSAASLSIRPACALSSLIDTNIEALK
jgi:hypothetical protein